MPIETEEEKPASIAALHPEVPPGDVPHGDPKAAGPCSDPQVASSAVPGETSVPKASLLLLVNHQWKRKLKES